jgi:K+-transporting ATPase ATPase A chain
MLDPFQPLGVAAPLANLLIGDVVFGGLGSGLYGMVMITLIAAFLGGLMIGRTPTYLGKRIGQGETQLAMIYALLTPLVVLVLSSVALVTAAGRAGLTANQGPRGLTEVIFAYASSMASNGLALGGLNADTPFYNLTTVVAMLGGRFALAAVALSLAGRLAAQGRTATSAGSLPTDTPQFGVLIVWPRSSSWAGSAGFRFSCWAP